MSGANSTPLGRMNPAIGAGKKTGISLLNPSYMTGGGPPPPNSPSHAHVGSMKREAVNDSPEESALDRKRKRRSRWQGDEKEKTFIPGMPTVLPSNMNKDQEEAYLLQLQVEELSRRLRSNDLGISPNPEDRSPSPEPIYNNEGKRLNTREYRTRKRLEDDRHAFITKMFSLNPEYKPPADYKPPVVKVSDKVMIPQEEHPDINFVGLLIGPRGNTLKSMEKETGGKIIIRGKGSVKEGKVGRKDGGPMPGEDEPLHAYVTASNPESVKKAVDKIKEIIRQGVEVPEGQNDLRRMQLRELALLNGTLRENDGPRCSNCGSNAHKSWQCPEKPNVTNNVVCTSCGGAGHIAKDCRQRKPGLGSPQAVDRQKIDEEYMSLMAELGEGPPPPQDKNTNNGNRTPVGTGAGTIRSLFDTPVAPPRAIAAPPPNQQTSPHSNRPTQNGNMPMKNIDGMPPNMPNLLGNMNPNGNQPNNWQNSNNGNNDSPFNLRGGNRSGPSNTGNNQQPNFNQPPPLNWQMNQSPNQGGNSRQGGGNSGNFPSIPPPNLLTAPPPPPPPTSQNSQQSQQQSTQQQQVPSWMGQAPPGPPAGGPHPGVPPPGMNPWQGPPPPPPGSMNAGGPPPGPVPPPRPVGPPPGWGWNTPPSVGPPPPPPPSGGQNQRSGVDLGALLSAPPPPPPS